MGSRRRERQALNQTIRQHSAACPAWQTSRVRRRAAAQKKTDFHINAIIADDVADIVGHPRGTLAIVIIFGVVFLLGWVALYVFRFLEHGAPHH